MRGRSVIEIMVLTFTFVVSLSLMGTGATIAIIEIRNPEADTDTAIEILFTAITIILGALLGMLTAKGTDNTELNLKDRPKDVNRFDAPD